MDLTLSRPTLGPLFEIHLNCEFHNRSKKPAMHYHVQICNAKEGRKCRNKRSANNLGKMINADLRNNKFLLLSALL